MILAISLMASVSLVGCSSEKQEFPQGDGFGQVALQCSVSDEVMTRADYGLTFDVPVADEFKLTITGTDYEKEFDPFTTYDPNENRLSAGDYTATAQWGDMEAEGENKPAYYGKADFTIIAQKTVQAEITAKLTKGVVKVAFTEGFLSYFHDEQVTMTTAAGNEFTFDSTTTDQAIFVCPGEIKLNAKALKQTEVEQVFAEKVENVAAQTLYTITFDLKSAGTATVVEISYNDKIIEEVVVGEVELNPED